MYKHANKEIPKAIEFFILILVDAELLKLQSWVNMKKAEIGAMTTAQIAAARAKAYGAAGKESFKKHSCIDWCYILSSRYRCIQEKLNN